jgi:hypothetical protein
LEKWLRECGSAKRWGIVMGIVGIAIAGGQTYIFKRQLVVFSDQKKLMMRQAQIMHRGLKATEKAADAAKLAVEAAMKSADAYVTSERPFVMIEARGEQGFEFWAVNHGKSPAQIIFSNPVPFVDTPLLSELPKTLNYGYGFDIPSAEQINVQWIAPGGSHSLGAFQPEFMSYISSETAKELAMSVRVMILYSAFKYRGIDGKRVYTSTYSYRKFPNGLQMWGGYGWNQYT